MSPLSSSPRKTRSRSRFVPGGLGEPPRNTPATHTLALSDVDSLAIPTIPVMKASSMEPVLDQTATTEKRPRHKMTDYQLLRLEELYKANTHPSRHAKETLAREIGMNFKSVLIWFQNRRQDRPRRNKTTTAKPAQTRASHETLFKITKPKTSQASQALTDAEVVYPLTATPEANSAAIRVHDSMAETTKSSYASVFSCHSPPSSRSQASSATISDDAPSHLWEFAPPSPPIAPSQPGPSSSPSPTPSPVDPAPLSNTCAPQQPFGNTSNLESRNRKVDLEWACANSAARRDHHVFAYQDEDDSAGESSDFENELSANDHRRVAGPKQRGRHVVVPHELRALFSPDVVQGASLLLTLKHSMG